MTLNPSASSKRGWSSTNTIPNTARTSLFAPQDLSLPPPPTLSAPAPVAPSASYGSRYPNTESYARDRIESQGYRVEQITPQNNGSWKAETSRNAVPTRPQGEPSKVTIYPDGRIVEEREPLTVNPPRP